MTRWTFKINGKEEVGTHIRGRCRRLLEVHKRASGPIRPILRLLSRTGVSLNMKNASSSRTSLTTWVTLYSLADLITRRKKAMLFADKNSQLILLNWNGFLSSPRISSVCIKFCTNSHTVELQIEKVLDFLLWKTSWTRLKSRRLNPYRRMAVISHTSTTRTKWTLYAFHWRVHQASCKLLIAIPTLRTGKSRQVVVTILKQSWMHIP